DARARLAAMIHAPPRPGRVPQTSVRGEHLGGGGAGAESAGQHAKRPVLSSRHRPENEVRAEHVRTEARAEMHAQGFACAAASAAQEMARSARRKTAISKPSASF